ncbi:MAG: DUF2478 domain-containing protein [Methylocystis sp.]
MRNQLTPRPYRIAALSGSSSHAIQNILANFAQRRRGEGARVAGVIEEARCSEPGACKSLGVRDLVSGQTISISQNLGPGSQACNLDLSGLAKACALVEEAIDDGAEIVILSKFGKSEAARSGLYDAFKAAVFADIPIVTAVPAVMIGDWESFSVGLAQFVDCESAALETWWLAQRPPH